jgi:hypothetical protein
MHLYFPRMLMLLPALDRRSGIASSSSTLFCSRSLHAPYAKDSLSTLLCYQGPQKERYRQAALELSQSVPLALSFESASLAYQKVVPVDYRVQYHNPRVLGHLNLAGLLQIFRIATSS